MSGTRFAVGRRSHGFDAESLQRKHIRHVSYEPTTVKGRDGELHTQAGFQSRRPLHFKYTLRLHSPHPCKAGAIAAVNRYTAPERDIACDRLRAQRRTTTRECNRQITNTLNLNGRTTAGFSRSRPGNRSVESGRRRWLRGP